MIEQGMEYGMREGYEQLDEMLAAEVMSGHRRRVRRRCRSTASSRTRTTTPGALFDWYEAGDVEVVNAGDPPALPSHARERRLLD